MPKRRKHHLKYISHLQANKIKKKIGIFYKFSFFIFLVSFVTLFYFLVLVSTSPKSFQFVTQRIQSYLEDNVDKKASIKESHLSFTRYGTLKISVDELKVFYAASKDQEKQEFLIPRLESEISLLNLLLFKITPNKVKIIDPRIVINNSQELSDDSSSETIQIATESNKQSLFLDIISAIRAEKIPIRNLEIENAEFLIKGKHIDTTILVKRSQIKSRFKRGILNIDTVNQLSFDRRKPDVKFNTNCQLENDNSLKCGLTLDNFEAKSITNLHPKLQILEQINSSFNVVASFVVDAQGLSNFIFKTQSAKGSFDFPEYFKQRMDFSNLIMNGEYHSDLGILSITEIKADFPTVQNAAHLQMIMSISNLKDPQNIQSDFDIKLQNVANDELEKFWPKNLNGGGVRDWVTSHIKGGTIKDSYAKFTLKKSGETQVLEKIESKVVFAGLNLTYSDSFPKITNLEGVTNFSKNDMKIVISGGHVLGSKISEAQVAIADFNAKTSILNISGKSQGAASDSLKHADNNKDFTSQVEKYLNGNSQNNFDIRIPLTDKITLKDSYIEVSSAITNLKNDYVEGAVNVITKKSVGSNDFVTALNLTNAKFYYKAFDIIKESAVEGGLDFAISFAETKKVLFKNISLWKKERNKISKISGNIGVETSPFLLSSLNLKNNSFGKNDYSFSYSLNKKSLSEKISLKGRVFNLEPLIENKFFSEAASGKKSDKMELQISVANILLMKNKSIKNLSLYLGCSGSFCYSGNINGNYNRKEIIALQISKKPTEDFSVINGRIGDIGYLAEALGISDKVLNGDAKLKLTNKVVGGKQVLAGEILIDDSITIFESAAVKKLSDDTLFSSIKDKIFSSEKITFDSLKVEFDLQDSILNLRSLVANNYKIGITAQGVVNLRDDSYQIRGMIVPGFIINNLFGIGKIPILGNVVSGLLTGGEGGGIFGIRYEYVKKKSDKEATFETNKVSAFVPTTIRSLFE